MGVEADQPRLGRGVVAEPGGQRRELLAQGGDDLGRQAGLVEMLGLAGDLVAHGAPGVDGCQQRRTRRGCGQRQGVQGGERLGDGRQVLG